MIESMNDWTPKIGGWVVALEDCTTFNCNTHPIKMGEIKRITNLGGSPSRIFWFEETINGAYDKCHFRQALQSEIPAGKRYVNMEEIKKPTLTPDFSIF